MDISVSHRGEQLVVTLAADAATVAALKAELFRRTGIEAENQQVRQTLGQLQPFIAVFPQECMGQPNTFLATGHKCHSCGAQVCRSHLSNEGRGLCCQTVRTRVTGWFGLRLVHRWTRRDTIGGLQRSAVLPMPSRVDALPEW